MYYPVKRLLGYYALRGKCYTLRIRRGTREATNFPVSVNAFPSETGLLIPSDFDSWGEWWEIELRRLHRASWQPPNVPVEEHESRSHMAPTEMRRKAALAALATLALVVLALLAVALFVSSAHVDSVSKMRELTLRQDLFVMRGMVAQYTLDKYERPQSLAALVAAGYLRQVPTDPLTGRNDTWVLEWSDDPKTPGITGIRIHPVAREMRGVAAYLSRPLGKNFLKRCKGSAFPTCFVSPVA